MIPQSADADAGVALGSNIDCVIIRAAGKNDKKSRPRWTDDDGQSNVPSKIAKRVALQGSYPRPRS